MGFEPRPLRYATSAVTYILRWYYAVRIYSSLFTKLVQRNIITQKTIKSERKIKANDLTKQIKTCKPLRFTNTIYDLYCLGLDNVNEDCDAEDIKRSAKKPQSELLLSGFDINTALTFRPG